MASLLPCHGLESLIFSFISFGSTAFVDLIFCSKVHPCSRMPVRRGMHPVKESSAGQSLALGGHGLLVLACGCCSGIFRIRGEHVFTWKLITPSLVQSGAGEVLHQGVVRSYVIQRGGPFNVRTNVTTPMQSNIILEGPWPPVTLGAGLTNAPGSLSAEAKHPFCRCCHEQAHVYLQAHIFEVLFESSF